jgi:hypothetical protein
MPHENEAFQFKGNINYQVKLLKDFLAASPGCTNNDINTTIAEPANNSIFPNVVAVLRHESFLYHFF